MTQWGLDTLFNPAKRHMDEEKRRLQSTREEIGDSSGGKRIDLESGKVIISRPAADAEREDGDDTTADDAGNADQKATVDEVSADERAYDAAGTGSAANGGSAVAEPDEHSV
jgi:Family of unknown function (DUF6191)